MIKKKNWAKDKQKGAGSKEERDEGESTAIVTRASLL